MQIERFDMERTQCLYEHAVEFNLSESGVLPLSLEEAVGAGSVRELAALRLKYAVSTGSDLLRERIGRFYGGADIDNVLVLNGGAEANFITLWALLEPADRFAFMVPNYLQGLGLGRALARRTETFRLKPQRSGGSRRWGLDRDSLLRAAGRGCKAIFVCNPNNPTGAVLDEEEMDFVVEVARRSGAWLVCDEIYRGAEVTGTALTPSFWGRYEKVIVTGGLSKAFGLPGLRLGWILGPASLLRRLCQYHDYTTLTPGFLSEKVATAVMEPAARDRIIQRTRDLIRRQLPLLEGWLARHADIFDCIRPRAGAIALPAYRLPISSVALFNRLREECSVLITPGGHFGLGKYLRIGYGYDADLMLRGLRRIEPVLKQLAARRR